VTLHQRRTHPVYVEGCFGCRASTIRISAEVAATTDAGRDVIETKQHWAQWDKDREAWKRMWNTGVAPSTITGSADVEQRASTEFEVKSRQIYDKPGQQKRLKTALTMLDDSGAA
jgi:hypothetical protein